MKTQTVYTVEQVQEAVKDPSRSSAILLEIASGVARIKKEKKHVEHRRKYDPNMEETQRVLDHVAKMCKAKHDWSDWLVFYLISMGDDGKGDGLRIGEVISNHRNGSNLPGLQVEDLRDDGVWVRGKKEHQELMPLTSEIVAMLRAIIGDRTTGPIFKELADHDDPVGTFDHRTKNYVREAGLPEWKHITPHRFRAGFAKYWKRDRGKQLDEVQGLMRHKDPKTTLTYTGQMPDEERKRIILGSQAELT